MDAAAGPSQAAAAPAAAAAATEPRDMKTWVQSKVMPLVDARAMTLKNADALREFVKLVRAVDKSVNPNELDVCRSVLVLVLTKTAPEVKRGFVKSVAMKEMINWTLEHIRQRSPQPSLAMIKLFDSLEFTVADLRELRMNVVLKQMMKELSDDSALQNACLALRSKWEEDIDRELAAVQQAQAMKALDDLKEDEERRQQQEHAAKQDHAKQEHAKQEQVTKQAQQQQQQQRTKASSSVAAPAPPLRKTSGDGSDGSSGSLKVPPKVKPEPAAAAAATATPAAAAATSPSRPAETLKRKADLPEPDAHVRRRPSEDASAAGVTQALQGAATKRKESGGAPPPKRPVIMGLQGYKSKDDITKEEPKISIIDDLPLAEAKPRTAASVRTGPVSAEDVKRQRLAERLSMKRAATEAEDLKVIVPPPPTSINLEAPVPVFDAAPAETTTPGAGPPASESPSEAAMDTAPAAAPSSLSSGTVGADVTASMDATAATATEPTRKQLRSSLKGASGPGRPKRRVSFPDTEDRLVSVRVFVSDPDEYSHHMPSDALWNSEMHEGRGLRRLEPVMAWQRPLAAIIPDHVVEYAGKRWSDCQLFAELHSREAVQLGESFISADMAPPSAQEPATPDDRGELVSFANAPVVIPMEAARPVLPEPVVPVVPVAARMPPPMEPGFHFPRYNPAPAPYTMPTAGPAYRPAPGPAIYEETWVSSPWAARPGGPTRPPGGRGRGGRGSGGRFRTGAWAGGQ